MAETNETRIERSNGNENNFWETKMKNFSKKGSNEKKKSDILVDQKYNSACITNYSVPIVMSKN